MDALDIKNRVLIVEKAKELLILLAEYRCDWDIKDLIKRHQDYIDEYNNENYAMVDPSSEEIHRFKTVKTKWIQSEYGYSESIYKLIQEMPLETDGFMMYILQKRRRKNRNCFTSSDDVNKASYALREVLMQTIKTTVISEFEKFKNHY